MAHAIVSRRHGGWTWIVALLAALLIALPAAAQTFPKFTGLVVDDAGVLSEPVKAELTTKLEALQKDTKRQLVVVTIRDMGGEDLAAYTNKLFRTWGVGLNDIDNGVVLLLAPNNPPGQRGPRIEVGYGLEPVLTDALSSVIINGDMMPRLKAGDIGGAVTAGVDAIDRQLRASPEEAKARQDAAEQEFNRTHQRRTSGGGRGGFPLGLVFWLLVIGFVVLSMARRGGGGGRRYRSGHGSGLGEVILWGIANEIANNAFRGGGGRGDDGVRGWDGGGGWGGGSDGSWGGGGFTGGGGGDSGGGGASGSW